MQRRFNVLVPASCPMCSSELTVTLDQIHDHERVRCSQCGTLVPLEPEDLFAPDLARPGRANTRFAHPD